MPIYMDIHHVPGVKTRDVAAAHALDLMHQGEFGCNCMTYWIDEARESIFCLIEAPDRDSVKAMHQKAHGLVPNKVIEVSNSVVQSFLGRIYDPDDAPVEDGKRIISDSGYRLLLLTRTLDHYMLRHCLGEEKARQVLSNLNNIVRKNIRQHNGSEAEHSGEGFVVSFKSATAAAECALAILNELPIEESAQLDFRLSLNGGEPIEQNHSDLFGDVIQRGNFLSELTERGKISLAGSVRELVSKELLQNKKDFFQVLSSPDEDFALSVFARLEDKYKDPKFDVPEFASELSMSQPQLYRKCVSVTGKSSNNLLKDFRLNKAREMMKTQRYSISQVTFETGFSSPSYFTKCFKTEFGLLPGEYLDLLKN